MNTERLEHLKHIKMTVEERQRVLGALEKHIGSVPSPFQVTVSPFLKLGQKTMTSALILCILVASGWGVVGSSASSLPGEPLYFLKRNVTESIVPMFIFNQEKLATYQASLATRRVTEARKLAQSGMLTLKTKQQLERSMNEHASKAVDLTESSDSGTSKVDKAVAVARLKGEIEAKVMTVSAVSQEKNSELSSDNDIKNETAALALNLSHTPRALSVSDRRELGTVALGEALKALDTVDDLRDKVKESSLKEDQKDQLIDSIGDIELKLVSAVKKSDHSKPSIQTESFSTMVSVASSLNSLSNDIDELIIEQDKKATAEDEPLPQISVPVVEAPQLPTIK